MSDIMTKAGILGVYRLESGLYNIAVLKYWLACYSLFFLLGLVSMRTKMPDILSLLCSSNTKVLNNNTDE